MTATPAESPPLRTNVANRIGRPDPVEAAVRAECVRLWLRSPSPIIASVILTICTAALLDGGLPRSVLWTWVAAGLALQAARWAIWQRYRRAPHDDRETMRWGRIMLACFVMGGLQWGVLGTFVNLADDGNIRLAITVIAMGMSAGAVASYAAWFPAVVGFTVPTMLPLIAALVIGPGTLILGLMGVVFLVVVLAAGAGYQRSLVQLLRVQRRHSDLTEDLQRAMRATESANRAKTAFIANMGHELRTPLNSIIGFSGMLKDELLGPLGDPRYVEYSGDVHASGRHLLSLLNDILEYARIEGDQMALERTAFDIGALLFACQAQMRDAAATAGLALDLEMNDPSLLLIGDENRLRRVVLGLLSNAIKFTASGGRVRLQAVRSSGKLEITVEDTGRGMDEAERDMALQAFVQVHAVNRAYSSGAGLGLPLAKSVVELHGGSMEIESKKGVGTRVQIVLPGLIEQDGG